MTAPKTSELMATNSVFEIQQWPTHERTIKSSFSALPSGIKLGRIMEEKLKTTTRVITADAESTRFKQAISVVLEKRLAL